MRSPADPVRLLLERALRTAALGLLTWAIWRVATAGSVERPLTLRGATVEREWPALLGGTHAAAVLRLEGTLPADSTRDALAALARAGVSVRWSGQAPAPLALTVERAREPDGALLIRAVGAGAVVIGDATSALDSLGDASRGFALRSVAPAGDISARGASARARATPPPLLQIRPVLVVGRPSWETKFTVAALEEQGWVVESRTSIAPGADVTTGSRQSLDTAHYAAIVALDSSAAEFAPALISYLRNGGGVLLLADAARLAAFRDVLPGAIGAHRASAKRSFDAAQPLASLALSPVTALRDDAVALDTQGGAVAIAARRERGGRIAVVGYEESWHWRLEGGDDAVAAHRTWWSHLVGAVAYRGDGAAVAAEGAPVARWFDALGAPVDAASTGAPAVPLPQWLLPVLCGILLAEWGSRRLRGAR